MANPFSQPKQPAPIVVPQEDLPPPPARSDSETAALADEQRKRFGGAGSGRSMTYLTGGGLSQGSSAIKFLGGAAHT